MAGLQLVTEAADYPVSLTRAKDHLRLSDQNDDGVVRGLIAAATQQIENATERSLINRTYRLFVDYVHETDYQLWEGTRVGPDIAYRRNYIDIPKGPLVSVTHIKSYDDSDSATTFSSDSYYVDTVNTPPRVVLRDGQSWPTGLRTANGIEIEYVAGYGSNDTDVPEPLRLAILQLITFMYEHRGDFEANTAPKMPSIVNALISPYKTITLTTTFDNKISTIY